jgi:hypothetical protein
MKKILLLTMLFSSLSLANAPNTQTMLVIKHVNIVNVIDGSIQPNMTVSIENKTIKNISPTQETSQTEQTQSIDATGKYMIPGLWDMHVHLARLGSELSFPLFLSNGIVGVRDMGMSWKNLTHIQQQKKWFSPLVVSTGPILENPPQSRPFRLIVKNKQEATQAVLNLKRKGINLVKVYDFMPRQAYFAAVKTAKKEGMFVVGHVPLSVSAIEASEAGQRSIEHLRGFPSLAIFPSEAQSKNQDETTIIKTYAKNNTWQTPTLITGHMFIEMLQGKTDSFEQDYRRKYFLNSVVKEWPSETAVLTQAQKEGLITKFSLDKMFPKVRMMNDINVPLLAGTDAGSAYVLPGFGLHDELMLLVKAGLTPLDALRTATVNPAKFFDQESIFGSIEVGKRADLVLLDSNPLNNIENTKQVRAVILNGKYLSREDLDLELFRLENEVYKSNKTPKN